MKKLTEEQIEQGNFDAGYRLALEHVRDVLYDEHLIGIAELLDEKLQYGFPLK